ncbi:hypothetical protein ACHQM5_004443 [Ranunculus cassubicifolius]
MNLDLCLNSACSSDSDSGSSGSACSLDLTLSIPSSSNSYNNGENESKKEEQSRETRLQRITIFYNGKICVCEATEDQARRILDCAKKQTEEAMQRNRNNSDTVASHLNSPTGICVKRSLQRFLEKRRDRIQSTRSPYKSLVRREVSEYNTLA